jgi:hypothetical protein
MCNLKNACYKLPDVILPVFVGGEPRQEGDPRITFVLCDGASRYPKHHQHGDCQRPLRTHVEVSRAQSDPPEWGFSFADRTKFLAKLEFLLFGAFFR